MSDVVTPSRGASKVYRGKRTGRPRDETRWRWANGVEQRRCSGCNQWLDWTFEHFHRHSEARGLQRRCKVCMRDQALTYWRARHPSTKPRTTKVDNTPFLLGELYK